MPYPVSAVRGRGVRHGGTYTPPDPPDADFSADNTTPDAGVQVIFTDASTGIVDAWFWSFGDGGFSTMQNPPHTYDSPGTYTVTLMVYGPGGSDSETKTDYITVTAVGSSYRSMYPYGMYPLGMYPLGMYP